MAGLSDAAAVLAYRKWVALGTALLVAASAFGLSVLLPSVYQAQARIMVDPRHFSGPGLATEAEMVRSTELVSEAVAALNLESDPEFSRQSAPEKKFLSLSVGHKEVDPQVLENVMRRLDVRPVEGSYVLEILFTSADAEKAALIANTLSDLYVRNSAGQPEDPSALQDDLKELENRLTRLRSLRQQENEARAERENLAKRYGPKHPHMVAVEQRLNDLGNAIQAVSASEGPDMLEQRIAAGRQALDALMDPAKRTGARLVSAAIPPAAPKDRIPAWGYGVAVLAGLLLGLLAAAINEALDKKVGTVRRLERLTSLTCLASIPPGEGAGPGLVLQKPASATADAVRTLRASLKLIGEKEGRPLRVVTVTSPSEPDVHPLLSIWLARLAARAGEKVLLIDANLRTPSLHTLLERSNTPSLVDYLTGQTHLEQIVWKQDPSGAHVIFASAVPNTAPDLIGSPKMTKLMGYLRQGYDLVVFCAPGCLNSADASLLANESDYTLYVVDAKATDRDDMLKGLKLFAGFGYTSLSPVLVYNE